MEYAVKDSKKDKLLRCFLNAMPFIIFGMMILVNTVIPGFCAGEYVSELSKLLKDITEVVGNIFRAVGIVMAVYAVGTLIMAFQNDNPDAQARGAKAAVVGLVLICLPTIITKLNLVGQLT